MAGRRRERGVGCQLRDSHVGVTDELIYEAIKARVRVKVLLRQHRDNACATWMLEQAFGVRGLESPELDLACRSVHQRQCQAIEVAPLALDCEQCKSSQMYFCNMRLL